MSKHPAPRPDAPPARQDGLHRLLFAGAALATTLLTLGAASGPKLPPSLDE